MADRYHLKPAIYWFNKNYTIASSECWVWTGKCNAAGYGQFHHKRIPVYAHRFSYEHYHGPILNFLVIDHLCRNPSCVNPKHLEAVSQKINVHRGEAKKTTCKNGHPYSEINCYIDKKGWPHCRLCSRERERAELKAKKPNTKMRGPYKSKHQVMSCGSGT